MTEKKRMNPLTFFLFTKLMDVREAMIGILQDRKESMEVRIGKVLAIAHDVQRRIRGEALFEIDQLLERYQKEKNRERFREKLEKIRPKSRSRYEIMSQMFQVFGKLESVKGGLEALYRICGAEAVWTR